MVFAMRNPIQPSPDRPIPLPDCILLDGWWADAKRGSRDRLIPLRLVIGETGEGPHDRRNPEQPPR